MRFYFFLLISSFFYSNFAIANINACLPLIKNKMQNGDLAFALGFGEMDELLIEINSFLKKYPKGKEEYEASFNKTREIKKGQAIEISYRYQLLTPIDEIIYIRYSLDRDGNFKIESKFDHTEYPLTTLTQSFSIKEDCSLHASLVEMENYKMIDTGDVKRTEYQFYNDNTLTGTETIIPWKHYSNFCDKLLHFDDNIKTLLQYAGTRISCFTTNLGLINFDIVKDKEENSHIKFDITLNRKAQFSKINTFLNDNKFLVYYASNESDYWYCYNYDNTISVIVTKEIWEKVSFLIEAQEEKKKNIQLNGFCFNDTARYSPF